jgi:hypothetical protein
MLGNCVPDFSWFIILPAHDGHWKLSSHSCVSSVFRVRFFLFSFLISLFLFYFLPFFRSPILISLTSYSFCISSSLFLAFILFLYLIFFSFSLRLPFYLIFLSFSPFSSFLVPLSYVFIKLYFFVFIIFIHLFFLSILLTLLFFIIPYLLSDRLCSLVVRVLGYRSRDPGFYSRCYQIFLEVVGLERGPLSLVSKTEELLGRKSSDSGLESREYGSRDPSRWPRSSL